VPLLLINMDFFSLVRLNADSQYFFDILYRVFEKYNLTGTFQQECLPTIFHSHYLQVFFFPIARSIFSLKGLIKDFELCAQSKGSRSCPLFVCTEKSLFDDFQPHKKNEIDF